MKQTLSCRLGRFAVREFGLVAILVLAIGAAAEGSTPGAGRPENSRTDSGALAWDAEFKDYTTKPGDRYAPFTFWFTNVSLQDVVIRSARSSCFCTVATLPQQPWTIAPGRSGPIEVTLDLLGKGGTVSKAVTVDASSGRKTLVVQARVTPALEHDNMTAASSPHSDVGERMNNRQTALADRQVVFKREDCASCHAEPAKGKTDGAGIYAAVCANCHDSPQRASMVPALQALRHGTSPDHWRKWITHGRAGSMMPAFARAEGGPLEDSQITALVDYLSRTIPSRPQAPLPFDAKAYAEAMSAFSLPASKTP